jgi:hypothetical protein
MEVTIPQWYLNPKNIHHWQRQVAGVNPVLSIGAVLDGQQTFHIKPIHRIGCARLSLVEVFKNLRGRRKGLSVNEQQNLMLMMITHRYRIGHQSMRNNQMSRMIIDILIKQIGSSHHQNLFL